jgi:hypothetical protein
MPQGDGTQEIELHPRRGNKVELKTLSGKENGIRREIESAAAGLYSTE